jgi:hypothetical protein
MVCVDAGRSPHFNQAALGSTTTTARPHNPPLWFFSSALLFPSIPLYFEWGQTQRRQPQKGDCSDRPPTPRSLFTAWLPVSIIDPPSGSHAAHQPRRDYALRATRSKAAPLSGASRGLRKWSPPQPARQFLLHKKAVKHPLFSLLS